jgi:hypothetical protein
MKGARVLLVAGIFLASVVSGANAGEKIAVPPSGGPITVPSDIVFDGYCDGVHYEAGPDAAVHGNTTGCISYVVEGARGPNGGLVHVHDCSTSPYTLLYVVRADYTWANYYVLNGTVAPYLTGTWHYGTPEPGATGQSTIPTGGGFGSGGDAGFPAEPILESQIALPTDIVFNGYCDGVHYASGPGAAVKGHVTGSAACIDPAQIIGARGARGGLVHMTDCTVYSGAYLYIVRADNTWANFYISGGSVYSLNAGTWSYGTPALEAGGGRSTVSR